MSVFFNLAKLLAGISCGRKSCSLFVHCKQLLSVANLLLSDLINYIIKFLNKTG